MNIIICCCCRADNMWRARAHATDTLKVSIKCLEAGDEPLRKTTVEKVCVQMCLSLREFVHTPIRSNCYPILNPLYETVLVAIAGPPSHAAPRLRHQRTVGLRHQQSSAPQL
eukprot:6212518-Pleurochrysis_carterae.AAC.16